MTTLRNIQIFLLLSIFLLLPLRALAAAPPAWALDFEAPVRWQKMTAYGVLLVNTKNGLFGIDGSTGDVRWSNAELAKVPGKHLQELSFSPYVALMDAASDKSKNNANRVVIVNTLTGIQTFDSEDAGFTLVLDKHVMPSSNALIVGGFGGSKKLKMAAYDLDSGEQLWNREIFSEVSGVMRFALALGMASQGASPLVDGPIDLQDGTFLITTLDAKIHLIDARSGITVWERKMKNALTIKMHLDSKLRDSMIVSVIGNAGSGVSSYFQRVSLESGELLWKKPKHWGKEYSEHLVFVDQGVIVSEAGKNGRRIKLLDYANGKSLWGKKGGGLKIKGGVVDHGFAQGKLVLATGHEGAFKNGADNLLYVLDTKNGALTFKKPLKVRGKLRYTQELRKGMLYVTSHEANVFDPHTGQKVSAKAALSKRGQLVTMATNRELYAYSGDTGDIHRIDFSTANSTLFTQSPVKLKGKNDALGLEQRGNSLVLLGRQQIVGFDGKGKVRFNEHHPAPKRPLYQQILMYAQAVHASGQVAVTGMVGESMTAAAKDAKNQMNAKVMQEVGKELSDASNEASHVVANYARSISRRFQASAGSDQFMFMLTRADNGNVGLAQVSKDNGRLVKIVDIGNDGKPKYEVDDVSKVILYRPEPNRVVGYQM